MTGRTDKAMTDAVPVVLPARVRPPTIQDVADAAGVTIGTASKALNGKGKLRPETRDRVKEAASALGFRPNELVRSLQRGRTYTVGLLSNADYNGRFSIPLLAGVEDALGAAEILVFFCNVRDDRERERKDIASLLAKQVDGIIVMGGRRDAREPISLESSRVPVVYAYTHVDRSDALCLVPDDAQGARLATAHLIGLNRRRFAHITGPADWESVPKRRGGMEQVLADHRYDLPDSHVLHGTWDEAWGYTAIDRLLARDPEIDAVFCGSDVIARGAIDRLRELGRAVPGDVSVVGFDNWDIVVTSSRPPLTSVDMNLYDLGREASARLLAMVAGEHQAGTYLLPCSLVVRESCGASLVSDAATG